MLTTEDAVKEIAAIYKLAGLSGMFVYWDIKNSKNPVLHIVDPTEVTSDPHELIAFMLSSVSPLYRAIISMIALTSMTLTNPTFSPIGWNKDKAMHDYIIHCLDHMANGSIQEFYNVKFKPDPEIPDVAKEIILNLLQPLKK